MATKNMFRAFLHQLSSRFSTVSLPHEHVTSASTKMGAWQIHSYGDLNELIETNNARIPHINSPDQVLVRIQAASVNPIDVAMIKGYGSTIFNFMRNPLSTVEFPLTLGRDFSGYVERTGVEVTDLLPGTKVWGVLPPHWQGSHAQYAIVKRCWVSSHPDNISGIAASGVLYAGLTAWSAINIFGGMMWGGAKGKRVLVLGPAGGVGMIAVQMLRSDGAYVVASCSTDAVPLVQSLGADLVFDRNEADVDKNINQAGPYDLILDCAGLGTAPALEKPWNYKTYVTCTSPLLRNADDIGLIMGTLKSAVDAACPNIQALAKGRSVRWAYFIPDSSGISKLKYLVEKKEVQPLVEQVYSFSQLPDAYKRVQEGHLRGKVIVNVSGENE